MTDDQRNVYLLFGGLVLLVIIMAMRSSR